MATTGPGSGEGRGDINRFNLPGLSSLREGGATETSKKSRATPAATQTAVLVPKPIIGTQNSDEDVPRPLPAIIRRTGEPSQSRPQTQSQRPRAKTTITAATRMRPRSRTIQAILGGKAQTAQGPIYPIPNLESDVRRASIASNTSAKSPTSVALVLPPETESSLRSLSPPLLPAHLHPLPSSSSNGLQGQESKRHDNGQGVLTTEELGRIGSTSRSNSTTEKAPEQTDRKTSVTAIQDRGNLVSTGAAGNPGNKPEAAIAVDVAPGVGGEVYDDGNNFKDVYDTDLDITRRGTAPETTGSTIRARYENLSNMMTGGRKQSTGGYQDGNEDTLQMQERKALNEDEDDDGNDGPLLSREKERKRAEEEAREREEERLDRERYEVIEHLDAIDPAMGAIANLQNCANTIVIPYFPSLYSRRATVSVPGIESRAERKRRRTATMTGRQPPDPAKIAEMPTSEAQQDQGHSRSPSFNPNRTMRSDKSLAGSVMSDKLLTAEEDQVRHQDHDQLDAHVTDVLTRRQRIRRILRGVWTFVKTPMGFITAVYGFLVAFWGAAIVLFLLGWIKTGSSENKDIWVEISSQVENGLFTVTGIGLIPWRVMDAYRMITIWRLKRLSRRLREKRGLPPISKEDEDDQLDPENDPNFVPVLSEKQQAQLRYQQEKFKASQTWYRPHATETHRAFSITYALTITLLIVLNSVFQIMLCCCMWIMNRHQRPAWTMGVLIPLSFLCMIIASILIWQGGEHTKKRKEVSNKLRQALDIEQVGELEKHSVVSENVAADAGSGDKRMGKRRRHWWSVSSRRSKGAVSDDNQKETFEVKSKAALAMVDNNSNDEDLSQALTGDHDSRKRKDDLVELGELGPKLHN